MRLFKRNRVPRRELTIDSVNELGDLMDSVVADMLDNSCPCRYPRFIELISFYHNNFEAGPVFCADTNYLISKAIQQENYLKEIEIISKNCLGDYDDVRYECSKCSSTFKRVANQYSINFEFEYIIVENLKSGSKTGPLPSYPAPLLQGLFGFKDKEIIKCSSQYKLSNKEEVFKYLTEIKLPTTQK